MVQAPCRFCGTGCGVMRMKVVATHGNMKAEVNRGLNCVKGYFLSKILYGADLLTQPLLPMISARRGLNCVKGSFLSKIMYDADLLQPLLRMDWRTRGFST